MALKEAGYVFKSSEDIPLFYKTRLELQFIFLDLCLYCESKHLPRPTITSTIRGKLARSVSATHEQGRALDIRSKVYSRDEILMMCEYINNKYAKNYGTAPLGKNPKCLIFEDISEDSHFHLQVRQ